MASVGNIYIHIPHIITQNIHKSDQLTKPISPVVLLLPGTDSPIPESSPYKMHNKKKPDGAIPESS